MQTDRKLSLSAAAPDLVQEYTTNFIASCYTVNITEKLMCHNRVGKSSKSVSKVSSLPPTPVSFIENVKRAHL